MSLLLYNAAEHVDLAAKERCPCPTFVNRAIPASLHEMRFLDRKITAGHAARCCAFFTAMFKTLEGELSGLIPQFTL